tara:strand:- start:5863 stop:6981 length:1119 start_codon:yes stop_codon:yes gene_type:complete
MLKFLFFLVHPAKFHFHKVQINELKKRGHEVDILITKKDILEELVLSEGWEYKNIYPEGRKIKYLHVYLAAVISIFRTVYRLLKFTYGKKYDLFIGDLTSILGRIKKTPSIYATDDVFSAVPEQAIFFQTTNYIIAPKITDIGRYITKKISYNGYKALAHLHPNHFTPNKKYIDETLRSNQKFFIIRCTGFQATHDINKKGISDETLFKIIEILKPLGKVFISSERELPKQLNKYELNINKNDINHYMSFAELFISDSTTMSTEAAILGTPSIEFDEYFYEIDQMIELQEKYNLVHCFRTSDEKGFLDKISELSSKSNIKKIYQKRREYLIKDKIDVSSFLIWFFENYPNSLKGYISEDSVQENFKSFEKNN